MIKVTDNLMTLVDKYLDAKPQPYDVAMCRTRYLKEIPIEVCKAIVECEDNDTTSWEDWEYKAVIMARYRDCELVQVLQLLELLRPLKYDLHKLAIEINKAVNV